MWPWAVVLKSERGTRDWPSSCVLGALPANGLDPAVQMALGAWRIMVWLLEVSVETQRVRGMGWVLRLGGTLGE